MSDGKNFSTPKPGWSTGEPGCQTTPVTTISNILKSPFLNFSDIVHSDWTHGILDGVYCHEATENGTQRSY